MHNQFRKWHRKGIRKEIDPKFLRNRRFAEKHNKKRHVNNTHAMSTRAKAIKAFIKPKEVKLRSQRVSCKLSQLVYIIHPKLGKCACVPITKGLRYSWPKAKARLKPSLRLQLQLQLRLRLPKVLRPP
ncbi:60S ribosomal protein L29-like [Myotis myotis]|uniref:60S ribosomal protein L29-like n=1 Tax=Myotis myotis TaxID=51298 RepID=UPI00174D8D28|nr:60S ribosomal protein L29-like [Myotis myotis]